MLAVAGAYGQTQPPIQLVTTSGALRGGAPGTVIEGAANGGSLTVTALAFSHWPGTTGTPPKFPGVMVYDVVSQPFLSPILSGQEEALLPGVLSQALAKPGPEVIAVVFEDGSSWGDAKWVQHMKQERAYLLKELTICLQGLQQAQQSERGGASRTAVAAQLQSAANNSRAAAVDGSDLKCVRMAWDGVLLNMRNAYAREGSLGVLLKNQVDTVTTLLVRVRSYGNVQ
jgi:hypothetical protein